MIPVETITNIIQTQGISSGLCVLILYLNYHQTREIMCMKNMIITCLVKRVEHDRSP